MILGLVLAGWLLVDDPSDLGARITQSAMAAQALQGPLDGDWTVRDRAGRSWHLRLVAAPGHPLQGAWRQADRLGPIDHVALKRGRLTLILDQPGEVLRLVPVRHGTQA